MKSLILLSIYILSFVVIFGILSIVVGLFMHSYTDAAMNTTWLGAYTLFLGGWLAIFPAREYYLKNEQNFNRVF